MMNTTLATAAISRSQESDDTAGPPADRSARKSRPSVMTRMFALHVITRPTAASSR
jgi:hypothetical protein